MSVAEYDYMNRAEFILAGFSVEAKDDGTYLLVSNAPLADGSADWQVFSSGAEMVVWLAAGISEIDTAGVVAGIYVRNAARRSKPA